MALRLQTEYLNDSNFENCTNVSHNNHSISSEYPIGKLKNLSLFNNNTEKMNKSSDYHSIANSRTSKETNASSGVEDVKKDDKRPMTNNERRKLNLNNVEDKLLSLARRDLDRRLNYSQLLLKREKTCF